MAIIISKHQIPVIQCRLKSVEFLQEVTLGVDLTMADLLRVADDCVEIIGVLDPENIKAPYREITEEVAEAYIETVRGSEMLVRDMPEYVQRSKAVQSYSEEPRYRRPNHNGTYQVLAGRAA